MKLCKLRIAGFRGFNEERVIEFHDKLTLISALNSHGKTSISEALEFLIYGETSKVSQADSKDEYKNSYRNRHYPIEQPTVIEAIFADLGVETTLRVEIELSGEISRFYNKTRVSNWPFLDALKTTAPPFVLQHALKYLLLAKPSERFQGFASLLGLNDVDVIQQQIVNLCTKPTASIPADAMRLLVELQAIEARIDSFPELIGVCQELKRGPEGIETAHKKIQARAELLLGRKYEEAEVLSALIGAREAAAARIYAGTVAIGNLTPTEQDQFLFLEKSIASLDARFVASFTELGSRDAIERVQHEAELLGLGRLFITEKPDICPLCGQTLDESRRADIEGRHVCLAAKLQISGETDVRIDSRRILRSAKSSLSGLVKFLQARMQGVLTASDRANQEKIQLLLGDDNVSSLQIISDAIGVLTPLLKWAQTLEAELNVAITTCETALAARTENVSQAEEAVRASERYIFAISACNKKLDEYEPILHGPSRLLQQAIDKIARTSELSAMIDFLEKKNAVARSLRVRKILEDLKDLKKYVDQTVGEVMEAAIGEDLSGSVMDWYSKIRTQGDPDVHFSGLGMEKTKSGDFKNKRVRIAAHSYGVELASAVSSLSESKLNALGLCLSIATALSASGPWDFLVIDDPIQSWDEDHETQFIEVVRSLAQDAKKQIILLSHRSNWIDRVALGCRALNGWRYQITGYTKEGPHLMVVDWAPVDQRLREALAIAEDSKATSIQLQQAEEEIRITACQLAADIAKRKLGKDRSAHNLNYVSVRTILLEASCPQPLLDRVTATFGTTDEAHHAPKDYQPNAHRIKQYHQSLCELKKWASG